jgi:uncharacterized metal-binding protein YceD (DUF177 family)
MSTLELELEKFKGDRFEGELSPSEDELQDLFEAFEDDFQVTEPDEFVIDLTAFLDDDTVVLTGEASGKFEYTCGRCLTERSLEISARLDFKLVPREEWDRMYQGEEEVALESDELDVDYYEGHEIDLRPFLRDAITLELPQWPHCPDELRDECNAAYEEHVGDETLERLEEHSVDLRWWPLKDIELDDAEGSDDETSETDES